MKRLLGVLTIAILFALGPGNLLIGSFVVYGMLGLFSLLCLYLSMALLSFVLDVNEDESLEWRIGSSAGISLFSVTSLVYFIFI